MDKLIFIAQRIISIKWLSKPQYAETMNLI